MSNEKISAMPAASTLDGTELVPLVQAGVNVQTDLDTVGALLAAVGATGATGAAGATGATGATGPNSAVVSTINVVWDSNTPVVNGTIPLALPPWSGGGTITSAKYYTNGASTPSFTFNVRIGGVSVTGLSAVTVSSATPASTSATAANTFTNSSSIDMVVSGVSGAPVQAIVEIVISTTLT